MPSLTRLGLLLFTPAALAGSLEEPVAGETAVAEVVERVATLAPPITPGLWAGHIVVNGVRNLPIIGKVEPRTETFVLAHVEERDGNIYIDQHPCYMDVKPVGGVKVDVNEQTQPRLPGANFHFAPGEGAELASQGWVTGWGSEDVDADGQPGVTFDVSALMCSGKLFLSSHAVFTSQARPSPGPSGTGLTGKLNLTIEQWVLGADGACLKLFARDSKDKMTGRFSYVPIPADSSCDSLPKEQWPVRLP